MKLEHIEYIVKVAQCQSISSAAKKLYVSQSTLSSVICSMESELGYILFKRSAKGIELTKEGQNALLLMQDICKKYDELRQINLNYSAKQKQNICLCVYPCLCSYLSIALSQKMQGERYQGIMLSVKDSLGLDNIVNGTADIAINHCELEEFPYYQRLMKNSDFIVEKLFEDQMCCYVNCGSRLAKEEAIYANELSSEHLAISQCCLKQHSINRFQKICEHITVLNQPDTVKQAVADGSVVGIVPGCSLIGNSNTKNRQIVRVPINDMDIQLVGFMVHRKNLSDAEKIVIESIKEILCE